MATHSSVLAWRIPGTVESGGLPSVGSHRVGHDWSNLAAAAAEICWNLVHFRRLLVIKVENLLGRSMCDIDRRRWYMVPEEKRQWIGEYTSIWHPRDQGRGRGCPLLCGGHLKCHLKQQSEVTGNIVVTVDLLSLK